MNLNELLLSLPPAEPVDPATCRHNNVDGMTDEDGNRTWWICRDCEMPFVPVSELKRYRLYAQRYKALRSSSRFNESTMEKLFCFAGEDFDEAVDAAIAEAGKR